MKSKKAKFYQKKTIRDRDKTKNVRGQNHGQNQKILVLSVPKIKDKTKKNMSLKMSEGQRDKTKNVSKKSLNHKGLSALRTKPKMSQKLGTKLGTDYLTLPSVDN